MAVIGFIVLFIVLGFGALLLGLVVERAVVARKVSRRQRTFVGVGSLLAYVVLIIPVNHWVGCGEDCTVDPTPLIIFLPLQLVGWFTGKWLGKQFRRSEADPADPS